jgi:hypothetical protein
MRILGELCRVSRYRFAAFSRVWLSVAPGAIYNAAVVVPEARA